MATARALLRTLAATGGLLSCVAGPAPAQNPQPGTCAAPLGALRAALTVSSA